jgi:hypothetical protein
MQSNQKTNEMAVQTVGGLTRQKRRNHAALRRCMQFMLIRYKKAKVKNIETSLTEGLPHKCRQEAQS